MGEEIAFENGRISHCQGLVTLTLTLNWVILHTVMCHSSTSTYIPNQRTFCGRTDGRTSETHFIRSTRRSRPKNGNKTSHRGTIWPWVFDIWNHCRVMMAWIHKTWNFGQQFCFFWGKNYPSQTVAIARIVPTICQDQATNLAHTTPDFIQIGSLLAKLLWNAWRPFLPHRLFTI